MAFRMGLAWSVAATAIGTNFCVGVLSLRLIRQTDDIWNYALSGAGTCISTFAYFEMSGFFPRMVMSRRLSVATIGIMCGLFYKFGEDFVFDKSRSFWLQRRQFLKHVSQPIVPPEFRRRPLPRELIGKVPPLQEGMSFEPEREEGPKNM
eukprot:CAMPEP_0185029996 /NCGR_PEP_ID=MMETSP1103-20130426/16710_1 /TAXON_ID=36769 /ORGANISM="Paraphysomonas bandaiensis, Strain Caron Lab Isolate" /LENGTH=149 /DNA_ID=CAMNT_0027564955 /DNA_START=167 /DNA_END=616 /DNA_ORIENTATION=+